jgi:hypothetical protein
MKKIIFSLLLTGLIPLLSGTIFAQSDVIKIEEIRNMGGRANTNDDKDAFEIPSKGSDVISIERDLRIKIDENELLKLIPNDLGLNEKLKELDLIIELLKYEEQLAIQFKALEASESYDQEEMKKLDEYLASVTTSIDSFPQLLALYQKYEMEYIKEANNDPEFSESFTLYVLDKIRQEGLLLEREIDLAISNSSYGLRLYGYMVNRQSGNRKQIHIENFDTLSNNEYYAFERWVYNFSEEDIQKFQKVNKLAAQLNKVLEEGPKELLSIAKQEVSSLECLASGLQDIKNALDNIEEGVNTDLDQIRGKLESQIGALKENIADHQKKLGAMELSSSSTNSNVLGVYNNLVNEFIKLGESGLQDWETMLKDLKTLDNIDNLQELLTELEECKNTFDKNLDRYQKFFKFLTDARQVQQSSKAFAEKALTFALNKIPDEGYVEMNTTGYRQPGDELIFKAEIGQRDPKGSFAKGTEKTIERRSLSMAPMGFYTRTKVHLTMARVPEMDTNSISNKFQFAPSASILLKYGSRNRFYNNYLDFSLGINFGANDFDSDGAPDLAMGGIFTLFKDTFGVGYNYNFTTDQPYWYLTLSIPFNALGIQNPLSKAAYP